MANERLYFTLFKADGEVSQLPRKPTPKMIKEILDCETVESITMGIKYNEKDHHDGTLLVDDLYVSKNNPVNTVLNRALNESGFWRNREYIMTNKDIVVLGDAIMVTKDSLLKPNMTVDSTVEYNEDGDKVWEKKGCIDALKKGFEFSEMMDLLAKGG